MSRELTRKEKTAIRSLVVTWCANYDREYGCLPLDSDCYMLGKCDGISTAAISGSPSCPLIRRWKRPL